MTSNRGSSDVTGTELSRTTKIDHDVKETCLGALQEGATMDEAAEICGVSKKSLNREMSRSAIFKRRVMAAREEGKANIADRAIELIKSYAYGTNDEKTDRNRLTAAIALANAFVPGFRGVTTVQGRIEHDVAVRSAVPRPQYKELPAPKISIDKPRSEPAKPKTRKVEIHDENGNYIGTKHEEV